MFKIIQLLKPFLIIIVQWLGIAFAALFVLFKVRQSGKDSVKNESIKATLEGVKIRDKIENTNLIASDDKLDKLRRKWQRD